MQAELAVVLTVGMRSAGHAIRPATANGTRNRCSEIVSASRPTRTDADGCGSAPRGVKIKRERKKKAKGSKRKPPSAWQLDGWDYWRGIMRDVVRRRNRRRAEKLAIARAHRDQMRARVGDGWESMRYDGEALRRARSGR